MGNSRDLETAKKVRNNIKSVDMLFIDGDHTMQGVIDDFINYKDLVNSGGYVIFDDYNDYACPPYPNNANFILLFSYHKFIIINHSVRRRL